MTVLRCLVFLVLANLESRSALVLFSLGIQYILKHVVDIGLDVLFDLLLENPIHQSLVCSACILQAKGHDPVAKVGIFSDKCCYLLVWSVHPNLVVSRVSVQEAEHLESGRFINQHINVGQRLCIFGACPVQISIVCAHLRFSIGFFDHAPFCLIISLSSLISYSISSCFHVVIPMLLFLVFSGSCFCLVVVRPINKLGQVPSLYELLYFVLQGLIVFYDMTDDAMVSTIFGHV